ncbi:MAG: hypothetical protein ABGX23_02425 [Nautiliaceae bacterium]
MSGAMNSNIKNSLFYQLVNLFDNISEVEDEYYRNIEKEKLFQLIAFVIFRDDVFETFFRLFELEASNIYEKNVEQIFSGESINNMKNLKNRLFKLAGYHYNEITNSMFDIYHLIKVIKLGKGKFYIKIEYTKLKSVLALKNLYTLPNYSNMPFSYKNRKIKILQIYTNLPEEINKQIYQLISKIGSDKQKHLSIKDVKCTDLKRKLTMLYLFRQIQKDYPNHKKQEHISILINKLKQLNKELKIDLIKKCKLLRDKFDKDTVYTEAKILYKEVSYPLNGKYIWGELDKYDKAIKFYNKSEK